MTVLRILCMYCKKSMGEKDGEGVSGDTSGICRECWEIHYPQWPYPEGDANGQSGTIVVCQHSVNKVLIRAERR